MESDSDSQKALDLAIRSVSAMVPMLVNEMALETAAHLAIRSVSAMVPMLVNVMALETAAD